MDSRSRFNNLNSLDTHLKTKAFSELNNMWARKDIYIIPRSMTLLRVTIPVWPIPGVQGVRCIRNLIIMNLEYYDGMLMTFIHAK